MADLVGFSFVRAVECELFVAVAIVVAAVVVAVVAIVSCSYVVVVASIVSYRLLSSA